MTVTAKVLLQATQLSAVQTTIYTVPQLTTTVVTKVSASNPTAGPVSFAVNIVPIGGAAGAGNVIIPLRPIATVATDACAEMSGQILNSGDFISAIASAGASINVRIDGYEIV